MGKGTKMVPDIEWVPKMVPDIKWVPKMVPDIEWVPFSCRAIGGTDAACLIDRGRAGVD